jgi:VanZ family protein
MRSNRLEWLLNNSLWRGVLIAYWMVLFAATHVPQDFPAVPTDHWDKVVHFFAYATLGGLLGITRRLHGETASLRRLLLLWAVIAIYGAFDEWSQPAVGRDADLIDWLADAAGAAAGLVITRYVNLDRANQ